jgi:hypothetical protein
MGGCAKLRSEINMSDYIRKALANPELLSVSKPSSLQHPIPLPVPLTKPATVPHWLIDTVMRKRNLLAGSSCWRLGR